MTRYGEIVNQVRTPQTESARADQVENNAGGFVFGVGPWQQLDRFLILGQCGATYYASEKSVVKNNVVALQKCLAEDGHRAVARIVEISDSGRAPKNDPAIFALAVAAGDPRPETRAAALAALPKVCRIGTHLFHFAADVQGFRKWGRSLRTAVARWYNDRSAESLAVQAVKYQQRDGWSHRDLLRLSHPTAKTPQHDAVFRWMVGGTEALDVERKRGKPIPRENLPAFVNAFVEVQAADQLADVLRLIREHNLPREALPTKWLNEPAVWETMLPHMGLTAMIRNLGKMTAIGLLKPMSAASAIVSETIANGEKIAAGRVHPMQFLLAQGIYRQGHGDKGKLSWTPDRAVGDALDAGFYAAFKSIEPTGKRTLIALDVSGSMTWGNIAGAPGITPRIASAAMAMVTARAEKTWHMMGFSSGLVEIPISATDRLDTVIQRIERIPMGGTDCSLPMQYAAGRDIGVDVFQVYTDNETYAGSVHPYQALNAYRAKCSPHAKLVVCGLTATEFTIADPNDAGMLDVVGMDAHAPSLMASFARGEV